VLDSAGKGWIVMRIGGEWRIVVTQIRLRFDRESIEIRFRFHLDSTQIGLRFDSDSMESGG